MEQIDGAPEKEKKAQDRVTLGQVESQHVDRWLKAVKEFSKGYLSLSKSDLVNFLVRLHKHELSPKELQRIRADHYDPIRHITWITPQIKQALQSGDMARVQELQAELRAVELSAARSDPGARADRWPEKNTPRRKRKPKTESMPNEQEQDVSTSDTHGAQESL